jgi:hypothetical protein
MSNGSRWFAALSIAAAALAAPTPAVSRPSDPCVTAHIDTPFWLPDGELHAPGTLTLCTIREFSPVANLHRVDVDGRTVGVFLSRKRMAEAKGALAPEVVFARDGAGNLRLLGYSIPERDGSIAYRLPAANPAGKASAVALGVPPPGEK